MRTNLVLRFAAAGLICMTPLKTWSQGVASWSAAVPASATAAPKASKQADRTLGKQVRAALASNRSVNAANISVRASSGAVTLYGTVPDQEQIDKAADIAGGVAGVISVKNRLTVQRAFDQ